MDNKNNTSQEIYEQLMRATNIITSLHVAPDTDSASSCLALKLVADGLGKKVTIVSPHKIPNYMNEFLDTSGILDETSVESLNLSDYDLFVALDVDVPKRLTDEETLSLPADLKTICIDHHVTNSYWADYNYVDVTKVSTCSVLYDLLVRQDVQIDTKLAEILMMGLLSDSGIFKHRETSIFDLSMATQLIKAGADMHEIILKMTYNQDLDDMKMKAIIYTNLKLVEEKPYAYTTVSIKDRENAGISPDKKFPPFSDNIKQLRGVDFVFALAEKVDGAYTLSMRSHDPEFDVTNIALLFNGGGHKNAAGGIVKDKNNIEDALSYVTSTINEYLDTQEVHN